MPEFSRRKLMGGVLAGGAASIFAASASAANSVSPTVTPSSTYVDVTTFGAKGDGITDDTNAIQAAIDSVVTIGNHRQKVSVFMPPGIYCCKRLNMVSNAALIGIPGFDYESPGGTIIKLIDSNSSTSPCLIDITNTRGVTLQGLSLDGSISQGGSAIHGIMRNDATPGGLSGLENSTRIDNCQIGDFSGDGLHIVNGWCWSLRHSYVFNNAGHGINYCGWDAFILDNWLSNNGGCGFAATGQNNSAVTFTANRVEWNHQHGMLIAKSAAFYTITGNYFDYSYLCGIAAVTATSDPQPVEQVTITGNFFYRSGHVGAASNSVDSSHIKLMGCCGVTCVGNTCRVGDDTGNLTGTLGPCYGIYYENLTDCVIMGNALHKGALKYLLSGRGGSNNAVANNQGSLFAK